MREFEIQLSSVQDVQAFVALATTCAFPVSVQDAAHRVNGKSFMEMFCLDYTRPVVCSVDCDRDEANGFQTAIADFLTGK